MTLAPKSLTIPSLLIIALLFLLFPLSSIDLCPDPGPAGTSFRPPQPPGFLQIQGKAGASPSTGQTRADFSRLKGLSNPPAPAPGIQIPLPPLATVLAAGTREGSP